MPSAVVDNMGFLTTPFTVETTQPDGLSGTLYSTPDEGTTPDSDAIDWCDGDCFTNANVATGSGVLAQLYVTPETIFNENLDATTLEFDLYYRCGDSFSFTVNGASPTAPSYGACKGNATEFDAQFFYTEYPDGTLTEVTGVPEPGAGALFTGALGFLLGARLLRSSRRRALTAST